MKQQQVANPFESADVLGSIAALDEPASSDDESYTIYSKKPVRQITFSSVGCNMTTEFSKEDTICNL